MRILVLTGIREELAPFLEEHPCDFEKATRTHRSRWYPDVHFSVAGPGLRNRKQVRRQLNALQPELVLNAGIVGSLREGLAAVGERLSLRAVVEAGSGVVFPGGPGKGTLVSVSQPVFDPADKFDLAWRHKADYCDMEAAPLLSLIGGLELAERTSVHFCKVAGDAPQDAQDYASEERLRGFSRLSRLGQWWTAVRFPGGPRALNRLLDHKATALVGLRTALHDSLKHVLDSGGGTDNLDSIFLPH